MANTDQIKEDEVLRRMLATPPAKHKPLRKDVRGRPARAEKAGGEKA